MSYAEQTHVGGTKLTASALNHMEKGISGAHEELEKKVSSSGHTPNQFLATDADGNVVTKGTVEGSADSGVAAAFPAAAARLLDAVLRNGVYYSDQTANIDALIAILTAGGTAQEGVSQSGSVLTIISGVTAVQDGDTLTIT